jgi:hypothetical protein
MPNFYTLSPTCLRIEQSASHKLYLRPTQQCWSVVETKNHPFFLSRPGLKALNPCQQIRDLRSFFSNVAGDYCFHSFQNKICGMILFKIIFWFLRHDCHVRAVPVQTLWAKAPSWKHNSVGKPICRTGPGALRLHPKLISQPHEPCTRYFP